jgi:hypothetical protein
LCWRTCNDKQKKALKASFDAEIAAAADATRVPIDGERAPPSWPSPARSGKKARSPRRPAPATKTTDDDNGADEPITAEAIVAPTSAPAAAERKRIAAITKVCGGKHDEIEAKAIEEGWSTEKVELEVLRASRPKHNGSFGINTGAGAAGRTRSSSRRRSAPRRDLRGREPRRSRSKA